MNVARTGSPAGEAAPVRPEGRKRLHEMNSLADMGRFPLAVYCGATGNVLVTITATRWMQQHVAWALPTAGSHVAQGWLTLLVWLAAVLALNLSTVVILRVLDRQDPSTFRYVEQMHFFTDQHRFSDWVYVVASANMSFWIVVAWCLFASFPGPAALAGLLAVAFLVTFSPVLLRMVRR
jgi:hypothetical protein